VFSLFICKKGSANLGWRRIRCSVIFIIKIGIACVLSLDFTCSWLEHGDCLALRVRFWCCFVGIDTLGGQSAISVLSGFVSQSMIGYFPIPFAHLLLPDRILLSVCFWLEVIQSSSLVLYLSLVLLQCTLPHKSAILKGTYFISPISWLFQPLLVIGRGVKRFCISLFSLVLFFLCHFLWTLITEARQKFRI